MLTTIMTVAIIVMSRVILMRKSTEEILEEYSLKFIFLCKKSSSARKSCNIFFIHPRSDRFLQSY